MIVSKCIGQKHRPLLSLLAGNKEIAEDMMRQFKTTSNVCIRKFAVALSTLGK